MMNVLLYAIALSLGQLYSFNTGSLNRMNTRQSSSQVPDSPRWILTKMLTNNGVQEVHGDKTWLRFDSIKGTIAGSGGCNRYGGSYQTSGDQLKIEQVFSTKMYCEGQAEIEQIYFDLLGRVTRLEQETDILSFYEGNKLLLNFKLEKGH